jgi:hypothetical protein
MYETLMLVPWSWLLAYVVWYSTSAKNSASITVKEAKLLWKIHKHNVSCQSRKRRIIKRRNKIIGFECGCGYTHIQKRPIVAGAPVPYVGSRDSQESVLDKLHAPYKSD